MYNYKPNAVANPYPPDNPDHDWFNSLDPQMQAAAAAGVNDALLSAAVEGDQGQGMRDLTTLPGYASDPQSVNEVYNQAYQGVMN